MRHRRLLPKIFLLIGVLTLFLLIKYRAPIKERISFNEQKLQINLDNFFIRSVPGQEDRRRPVTLIQKESELAEYVGEPFRSFSRAEWEEFWNVCYGYFPREAPEKEGLPSRMRQLTFDEIADELVQLYPEPFAYFQEKNWESFLRFLFSR